MSIHVGLHWGASGEESFVVSLWTKTNLHVRTCRAVSKLPSHCAKSIFSKHTKRLSVSSQGAQTALGSTKDSLFLILRVNVNSFSTCFIREWRNGIWDFFSPREKLPVQYVVRFLRSNECSLRTLENIQNARSFLSAIWTHSEAHVFIRKTKWICSLILSLKYYIHRINGNSVMSLCWLEVYE